MSDGWYAGRPEKDRDRGPVWPDYTGAGIICLILGGVIAGLVELL